MLCTGHHATEDFFTWELVSDESKLLGAEGTIRILPHDPRRTKELIISTAQHVFLQNQKVSQIAERH